MIRSCLILVLIVGVFSCTKTINSNALQHSLVGVLLLGENRLYNIII